MVRVCKIRHSRECGNPLRRRHFLTCPCGAMDTGRRRYDSVSVAGNFILNAGLGADRIESFQINPGHLKTVYGQINSAYSLDFVRCIWHQVQPCPVSWLLSCQFVPVFYLLRQSLNCNCVDWRLRFLSVRRFRLCEFDILIHNFEMCFAFLSLSGASFCCSCLG